MNQQPRTSKQPYAYRWLAYVVGGVCFAMWWSAVQTDEQGEQIAPDLAVPMLVLGILTLALGFYLRNRAGDIARRRDTPI